MRQLSRRLVLTLFLLLGINDARCHPDDKTLCFLDLSCRLISSNISSNISPIFTCLGAARCMPRVRLVAFGEGWWCLGVAHHLLLHPPHPLLHSSAEEGGDQEQDPGDRQDGQGLLRAQVPRLVGAVAVMLVF